MDNLQYNNDLQLNDLSKEYLLESSKWGKFLAIAGFVMCAIMVILGFFMGTFFSTISPVMLPTSSSVGTSRVLISSVMVFFYIMFAAIYFFPCLYLYRFSTLTKQAILNNDTDTLTLAFQNQKSLFKYLGIVTAIILVFYAIILFFGIIGVLFTSHH